MRPLSKQLDLIRLVNQLFVKISIKKVESNTASSLLPPTKIIIEVFKTDVTEVAVASSIQDALLNALPACKINFDLQDCDRILRIEGKVVQLDLVTNIVSSQGHLCERLM